MQAITGPDVMLFYSDWNTKSQSHVDASKLECGAMLAQEKNGMLRSDLHPEHFHQLIHVG